MRQAHPLHVDKMRAPLGKQTSTRSRCWPPRRFPPFRRRGQRRLPWPWTIPSPRTRSTSPAALEFTSVNLPPSCGVARNRRRVASYARGQTMNARTADRPLPSGIGGHLPHPLLDSTHCPPDTVNTCSIAVFPARAGSGGEWSRWGSTAAAVGRSWSVPCPGRWSRRPGVAGTARHGRGSGRDTQAHRRIWSTGT
jgi:hypothetical protein